MARTNSIQQNKIDPTRPFYAAVGGVDVAVALARTSISEAQTRLAKNGLQKEAKAIPSRVSSRVEAKVNEYVTEISETVDDLNQQYVDLAARGRTLVNRIRGQQATQDLKAEAKKTTSRAKTTRTQAANTADKAGSAAKRTADQAGEAAKKTVDSAKRSAKATGNSAKTVKSSAKATGTSARKTASAATKATQAAAAKTGTKTNA